jgi:tetratricopeptide (TPR) repeat protein
MFAFLKGHNLFIKRRFDQANLKFEKCMKHPRFQNVLSYSLYGQSLCAIGELEEAHKYLIKACESYESDGWEFEDQFEYDIAKSCLSALKHTCHNLKTDNGKQYIDNALKIKNK